MADRRLAYAVLLAAAVVLYIFYEAFLSWYLLLAVLLCPLLSILISLPAMRKVSIKIAAQSSVIKGQSSEISVEVAANSHLPFGELSFSFEIEDQYGQYLVRPKDYSLAGFGGACLHLSVPTSHCGVLTASIYGGRVTDLLGLFSRKLKHVEPALTLVLPVPAQPTSLPPLPEDGPLVVKPGGGFAEDYELRAYRAGDAVRSIHWKLSAKADDLIVRDALVPQDSQCPISISYGGTPDQIDLTLSHLVWLSTWLTEREIPHIFYWYDYRNEVRQQLVTNQQSLDELVKILLLSIPPETPKYPPVHQAFYLDGEEVTL